MQQFRSLMIRASLNPCFHKSWFVLLQCSYLYESSYIHDDGRIRPQRVVNKYYDEYSHLLRNGSETQVPAAAE
jgi:hypothetical protein